MSNAVKVPLYMRKALETYVSKDLHQFFRFTDDSITFESKNNKTLMYGPNFVPQLRNFFSFPGSCEMYTELAEPLGPTPRNGKNSDGLEYTTKQGLLTDLQRLIPRDTFDQETMNLIVSIAAFFLRTKSIDLDYNLVRCHPELLVEVGMNLLHFKASEINRNVKMEDAFEELKKMLPIHPKDPEFSSILNVLKKYEKKSNLKKKPYFKILCFVKMILVEFEKFLQKYPQPDKSIPIVRVFNHGNDRLVLAHELLEKMEEAKIDVNAIKEKIERMEQLETIKCNDLFLQDDRIEFVYTSIHRTEHRSLPIPSLNGEFCITASDFLLETLREAVTVKSVFQCVNQENVYSVFGLFNEFGMEVTKTVKYSRFIDIKLAKNLKESFFTKMENLLGESLKKTKNIRKVGPKGFNLEDLQNEVRYLGLHIAFPELVSQCEKKFSVLANEKKPRNFETSDMYSILERLQAYLLINRVPNIARFLHVQNTCKRISLVCDYCTGKLQLEPIDKDKLEVTVQLNDNEEVTSESGENSEEVLEEDPTPLSSEDTSSSSESASDEEEKKTKKREKRQRQAEKKKSAKAESQSLDTDDVKTPESESKVCEKCFRTSQMCNTANEKLREERVKNKALKKELNTILTELELIKKREMEKDEEIRILKEKLAASEEIVAEFQNSEDLELDPIDEIPVVVTISEADESRPDMMGVLLKLMDIKDAMPAAQKEATELCEELLNKTEQKKYHGLVESEMVKFRSDYSVYYQLVEEHINWIRKNPNERLDLLRLLPHYPELSQDFHKAYDNVVNKKELDDQECLICMESMEEETGTVKCNSCRRRYHMSCAWDWSIVKNECAVCKKEIEFPLEE